MRVQKALSRPALKPLEKKVAAAFERAERTEEDVSQAKGREGIDIRPFKGATRVFLTPSGGTT